MNVIPIIRLFTYGTRILLEVFKVSWIIGSISLLIALCVIFTIFQISSRIQKKRNIQHREHSNIEARFTKSNRSSKGGAY